MQGMVEVPLSGWGADRYPTTTTTTTTTAATTTAVAAAGFHAFLSHDVPFSERALADVGET